MVLVSLFLSLLAIAHVVRGHSQSRRAKGSVITPAITDQINQILQNGTVPGYSVAIVHVGDGGGVEYGVWGNRTEDGDLVQPDTLFGIGSASKAFLATSIGILIDDFANGRNESALPNGLSELSWDTKLAHLLREDWKLMDPDASRNVALKDALAHLSGLPGHDWSYSRNDTIQSVTRRLQYLRPAFELREQWIYNSQMYVAVSGIIERYSGQAYPDFVKSRIFTPLNMTSSTFSPSIANATERFTQSWSADGRRIPTWFDDNTSHMLAGAGGVIASAEDMAKWITLLLGGVEGVPKAAYEVPQEPHAIGILSIKTYGLGWVQDTILGHPIVWHNGEIPGVSSFVTLFPEDKIGIVQLANADAKDHINLQVLNILAPAVLGGKFEESGLLAGFKESKTSAVSNPAAPARRTEGFNLTSLEDLAGTYTDPGYGAITLCAPSSAAASCAPVLAAFSAVNANTTQADSLFAAWPRVWVDHLELARSADSTFMLIPTNLFPRGFARDQTPFQTSAPDGSRAVFDVTDGGQVRGFGIIGLDGLVTRRQKEAGGVEEKADVWFQRVDDAADKGQ